MKPESLSALKFPGAGRKSVAAGTCVSTAAVVGVAVFYQDSGEADKIEVYWFGCSGGIEGDA
jgi:hypothetical protein